MYNCLKKYKNWRECRHDHLVKFSAQCKPINNAIESGEKAIFSLGGGAFDNPHTRDLLLKKTRVIWLNVPVETLINRVGEGTKRPMIRGNVAKSIGEILIKRVKYYSLSHHNLNTYNLSQELITKRIIEIIASKN